MTFAIVGSKKDGQKLKVIVKFNGSPENDDDIDSYLQKLADIYDQNERFVILYDASAIGIVSPKYLWRQVTFMRTYDAKTKQLMLKCAIVVSSPAARLALKTIFYAKPPACEMQVFSDDAGGRTEAKRFLKDI
jgi:hypothetical protein